MRRSDVSVHPVDFLYLFPSSVEVCWEICCSKAAFKVQS